MENNYLWDAPVYADIKEEVDPFNSPERFRPLDRTYDGDNSFWSVPSPEPELKDDFWSLVEEHMDSHEIREAAVRLAASILAREEDPEKLVFAGILRAGAPVADWLTRLLPGSKAVFLSLFVGVGVDAEAVRLIKETYPKRKIIFVDGWTGRGGVAREVASTGVGPLAVLNDPWGWADFSGSQKDIFCPSACFTGASTLGFSRTFIQGKGDLYAAYRFPKKHGKPDLVKRWQALCPEGIPGYARVSHEGPIKKPFYKETALRIHSNEVCRALINADPEEIRFFHSKEYVKENYPLLLALAQRRDVKVKWNVKELDRFKTRVACAIKNPAKK